MIIQTQQHSMRYIWGRLNYDDEIIIKFLLFDNNDYELYYRRRCVEIKNILQKPTGTLLRGTTQYYKNKQYVCNCTLLYRNLPWFFSKGRYNQIRVPLITWLVIIFTQAEWSSKFRTPWQASSLDMGISKMSSSVSALSEPTSSSKIQHPSYVFFFVLWGFIN